MVKRAALGEAARFPFALGGGGRLMRTEGEEGGREGRRAVADERDVYLAEIARALAEIVSELKEANTSLKAIARSQAQRATQRRPASES
jgi:hypothetical protein